MLAVVSEFGAGPGRGGDTMTNTSPKPTVETWAVDRPRLDAENARLPEDLEDRSRTGLAPYFEDAYELEELAWSMVEHRLLQGRAVADHHEPG
jgi:hypothetical protein